MALGSKSPPPAGSIQPARGANLPGRWIRAARTQNRSVSRAVRVGLVVLGVALLIIAVLDRPGDRLGFTPVPRTQAPADTGCLTIASKVGEAPFCDTGGATPHVNPQIQTTPLRGGPPVLARIPRFAWLDHTSRTARPSSRRRRGSFEVGRRKRPIGSSGRSHSRPRSTSVRRLSLHA